MTSRIEEGREAESIWFNGANGDHSIGAEGNHQLVFRSEYHGDRTDEWIDQVVDGVVVVSHNCRYIASIRWKP